MMAYRLRLAVQRSPDEPMPAAKTGRSLILVVDDDPFVLPLIADALATEGYEVDTATNGREALDRIAARSFDLIVSDLRMPEFDGVALYHELERCQPSLLARLVFVSGTTDLAQYSAFIEKSGVPVLSKPFHLEVLRRMIAQSLRDH